MAASLRQLLTEAAAKVAFVDAEEMAAGDALVLDVREREAFAAGHIPGALNLPRGELEWQADRELPDPNQYILVCCGNGDGDPGCRHPARAGFRPGRRASGGLKAWQDKELPLSRA